MNIDTKTLRESAKEHALEGRLRTATLLLDAADTLESLTVECAGLRERLAALRYELELIRTVDGTELSGGAWRNWSATPRA